mgnify:CR=1 FL=1
MNYFITYQVNNHIYQLKDPMGVLTTLVIGKDKALLVDTAYGIGDLKEAIRNITTLPLLVINSHGHMDHSCGNYLFDEVGWGSYEYEISKKALENTIYSVSVYDDELSSISWSTGYSLNTGNISVFAKVGRVVVLNLTIDHTSQLNSGDVYDICTLPAALLPDKNLPLIGMIYRSGTMHSAYIQAAFKSLRFVPNANIPAGSALEIFGIWAI